MADKTGPCSSSTHKQNVIIISIIINYNYIIIVDTSKFQFLQAKYFSLSSYRIENFLPKLHEANREQGAARIRQLEEQCFQHADSLKRYDASLRHGFTTISEEYGVLMLFSHTYFR